MSPIASLPQSLPLSHHLSADVKSAAPNKMKSLGALMSDPSLVSLGGGMPHHSLFPMSSLQCTIPALSTLGNVSDWAAGSAETETFELTTMTGSVPLKKGLQYGLSKAFDEVLEPLTKLTQLIHSPPYADPSVVLSLGCTDAVSKTFLLFTDKHTAPNVLCEEFSFVASLNTGRSRGLIFHGVQVDEDGMVPEDLERVLSSWNEQEKGPKPRLMYTIPCGQNPTGSVPTEERFEAIYKICQEHDVIIMEDDPYHSLQFTPYTFDLTLRKSRQSSHPLPPTLPKDADEDAKDEETYAVAKAFNEYAGVRSFLSRDVEGRVCRLDSISKIFAPGMRLGWITSNSVFADRYLRVGESYTQTPNGVGQAILASYLSPDQGWGISGFMRWIYGIRIEYERKRDFFCDNFARLVKPEYAHAVPAKGGMFNSIVVNISSHPRFKAISPAPMDGSSATNTVPLMDELFELFLERKLLVIPASMFKSSVGPSSLDDRCNFFRATFAGETAQIEAALEIFGRVIEEWFGNVAQPESEGVPMAAM